jgi:hypothetical protein
MASKLVTILLISLVLFFNYDEQKGFIAANTGNSWIVGMSQEFDDINVQPGVITKDSEEYIYVAGQCSFKNDPVDSHSAGIFVAKYNSEGEQVWHKSWRSHWSCGITGITADSVNNIYIVGYDGSFSLEIPGYNDPRINQPWGSKIGFLIKIDIDGQSTLIDTWEAYHDPEGGPRQIHKICCDLYDNIYIISEVYNFRKYNSDGQLLWAVQSGVFQTDIAIDDFGNIYLIGFYYNLGQWQPEADFQYDIDQEHQQSIIVVKFDPDHDVIWYKYWPVDLIYTYPNLCIRSNYFYIADKFVKPFDFNADGNPGNENDTAYSRGSYISKFDLDGNYLWTTTWESPYSDTKAIDSDACGNIYLMGIYSGQGDFNSEFRTDDSTEGWYICKFDEDGNIQNLVTWCTKSDWIYIWPFDLECDQCDLLYVTTNTDWNLYIDNNVLKYNLGIPNDSGYIIKLNLPNLH